MLQAGVSERHDRHKNNAFPFGQKNPSDGLFMRPLDDNNAGARPIARGIGRTALDRGPGFEEIAVRCPFLGGCAPHRSGQRIHSGPAQPSFHLQSGKRSI
jgi:hypothetical protein